MKSRSAWTLGAVVLIALIVASNLFFGLIPTANSIQSLDQKTQQTNSENQAREHYLVLLRNRAKNKDHFYVALSKQRNQIPDSLQVVEFMNEFDSSINHSGVSIVSLTLGQPQPFITPATITHSAQFAAAATALPVGKLQFAQLNLSVKGSLDQIDAFLAQVATMPRYVLISSVGVQPDQSSTTATASGQMTATLMGQVFQYGNQ